MGPQEQQNQERKEVKKVSRKLKIIGIVTGALVVLYAANLIYAYIKIQRGDVMKWGGEWYTKEELAQKFPPQYAETPAKNTPEEVYTTFRQALLDNNLELALEQITAKQQEIYRKILSEEESMEKWGKKLPEKITREEEQGNYARYDIDMGTGNKNNVGFFKAIDGIWKIDSI